MLRLGRSSQPLGGRSLRPFQDLPAPLHLRPAPVSRPPRRLPAHLSADFLPCCPPRQAESAASGAAPRHAQGEKGRGHDHHDVFLRQRWRRLWRRRSPAAWHLSETVWRNEGRGLEERGEGGIWRRARGVFRWGWGGRDAGTIPETGNWAFCADDIGWWGFSVVLFWLCLVFLMHSLFLPFYLFLFFCQGVSLL